jgi:hypothetical protein
MTHGKTTQCVGGDRGKLIIIIIIIIIIIEVTVRASLYRPKSQAGVEVNSTLSLTSALYGVGV